jgi:MinD superfamily P-loop ATPase
MKSLVLCNQKGGVGKTAVAILLAHYVAHRGRRVLAIDLDHQGNFTKPLRLSGRATLSTFASDAAVRPSSIAMQDEFDIECLCGATAFERVVVQRGVQPPLVTDFVACVSCKVMYHLPLRNDDARRQPEIAHGALAYRKPGHRRR